jgi:flagellar hook-length control protein FliK
MQQSPAASVNSAKPAGKDQDFAAALSHAETKPPRKTSAARSPAPGSVGAQLPAPGNPSPPAALPMPSAGAAGPKAPDGAAATAGAASPASSIRAGTTDTAQSPGGDLEVAATGSRSAPVIGAGSAATAGLEGENFPGAAVPGIALALELPAAIPGAAGASLGEKTVASPAGVAPAGLVKPSPAAGAGRSAAGTPMTAAAATAARNAATSVPNTTAPANASAPANADAPGPAATAAAIAAAAAGVIAPGGSDFAGAAESAPTPTNDSGPQGPLARGGKGPIGAPARGLEVPIPRILASAVPTGGANAQTVATLGNAGASDKHAPGGFESSLLSGSLGGAAGALQSAVNPAALTDAAATPALKVAAGVDTPEFGQGLAERVSFMVESNLNGAKLQVNPPQLGPIEVRIALQGAHAQIWLTSHSAVTRDALESSSPKLREMLGAQGFGQVTVDISHRSFQERSPQPPSYDWTPSTSGSPPVAAVQATERVLPPTPSGAIDAYA